MGFGFSTGSSPTDWADILNKPSTFTPSTHEHAASEITSGVFDPARLGSGATASGKVLYGDGQWKDAPGGAVESVNGATGVVVLGAADVGASPTGHGHAAADITSGVFAPARLATGTQTGEKFLRDDGTWSQVQAANVSNNPAIIQSTQTGVASSGEITISHGTETNFARIYSAHKFVAGPTIINTSLDYDFADKNNFDQQDSVNGTAFVKGSVQLKAVNRNLNKISGNKNNSTDNSTLEWITLRPESTVTARYVRLPITKACNGTAQTGHTGWAEVEVYDDTDTKLTGITATATSSFEDASHSPSHAVDGSVTVNNSAGWLSAAAPDSFDTATGLPTHGRGFEAIMLDLGSNKNISRIRVVHTEDGSNSLRQPEDFEVQFSTDTTVVAIDPLNSSKWTSYNMLNGKSDNTEKAMDAESGGTAIDTSFGASADMVPTMTAATTSGVTISATTEADANQAAWKVFDDDNATNWSSTLADTAPKITIDFGSAVVINKYRILPHTNNAGNNKPTDWILEGSSDNVSWTTLDTKSGQSMTDTWNNYNISNTTAYRYYRYSISAIQGGLGTYTAALQEIQLHKSTVYPTSQGYYVTTNNGGQINTANIEKITSIVITSTAPANTELKYALSFDGRTTWKIWNGSSWVALTAIGDIAASGMTEATLEGLGEAQYLAAGGYVPGTLDFASFLKTTDQHTTSSIDLNTINGQQYGHYLAMTPGTDFSVQMFNASTIFKNLTANPIDWKVQVMF